MSKFRVAIVGGGISGLCLAGQLLKAGNIQVDVYESSNKFNELGAGITLWGRVCEAMHLMGLAEDCIEASVVAASSTGLPTTTGFKLRGFHQTDVDFGGLPVTDAWSLHRANLLHILLRRVPEANTHLGKKLKTYVYDDATQTTRLEFSDDEMMRKEAQTSGSKGAMRRPVPRWRGTIAYRALVPTSSLIAKNPNHSVITGGQLYLGKSQHIIAYPISQTTTNIVLNVTDLSKEKTTWPAPSWSHELEQKQFAEEIAPLFADWDPEPLELIQTIDSSIGWAIHDLEPLPFYTKGRVVLVGDAAHASMPYVGAGAAYGLEDAYVLSRVLCAEATNRKTLAMALEAYQAIRLPYGDKHILRSRESLRTCQYNGPHGSDMTRIPELFHTIFQDVLGAGESGPEADGNKAISLLEEKVSGISNS